MKTALFLAAALWWTVYLSKPDNTWYFAAAVLCSVAWALAVMARWARP